MPAMTNLQELFKKELRDIYDAERQMSRSIPKMAKAASSDELRMAFEEHQQQTLEQIQRLEQVFQELQEKPRGTRCTGMAGILEEGVEVLSIGGDDNVLDAALIGAAQKSEHYEIAAYGTLVTFARTLGQEGPAELLQQTLEEEKETDRKLTEIAESMVNQQAASGSEQEEGEAGGEQAQGGQGGGQSRSRKSRGGASSGRGRSQGGSQSRSSSRSSSAKSSKSAGGRGSQSGSRSGGSGRSSRGGSQGRSGGRGR